jgi:ferredoxin
MKISIDTDACTGHGRCYTMVPSLFDADDHGHGLVVHAEVTPANEGRARIAVRNCPEGAIALEDGS